MAACACLPDGLVRLTPVHLFFCAKTGREGRGGGGGEGVRQGRERAKDCVCVRGKGGGG